MRQIISTSTSNTPINVEDPKATSTTFVNEGALSDGSEDDEGAGEATKHCKCTFGVRNPNSNFLPIESAKKRRAASSTRTSTPQSLVHLPESDDEDDEQPPPCSYHVCFRNHLEFLLRSVLAKKTRTSLGNPMVVDKNGFLADINVQSIETNSETWAEKWRDIDQFFYLPVEKTINGKIKKYSACKICPYVHIL